MSDHGKICPLSFIFLPRHLGYPRVNVCISVQNSRICSSILPDDVFKLCVKTLFISENFLSYIQRLLCIVRNCIILYSQDVVFGHFAVRQNGSLRWLLFHYPPPGRENEPIELLEIPTSPSMYLLIVILKLHQFRLPLSMIF